MHHTRNYKDNEFWYDLTKLIRVYETDWELEPGALTKGHIVQVSSGANRAVLTEEGGAVMCSDKTLASQLTILAGTWEPDRGYSLLFENMERIVRQFYPTASCSLNVVLRHCGIAGNESADENRWRVESVDPKELWPNNGEPGSGPKIEHLFAVRDGALMISRATDIKSTCIDGVWLHAVGVGTHPDYHGRGLAKAVVSAIVKQIIAENGVPLWNCDALNHPSLRVARSTGFKEFMLVFSWG